jgi:hypothetical protein
MSSRNPAQEQAPEIPPFVRTFLSTLNEQKVNELVEIISIYEHMPEETRGWLRDLRSEDIKRMRDISETFDNGRVILKFGKWVGGTIVAAVILGATFGKSVIDIYHLIRGGK